MGSSSSSMTTEPKALKDGIKIIDDALDRQYDMLVKLADECNNLRAEKDKKSAEVKKLDEQYAQCRSALEVLSKRDASLRTSVAKANDRYTGQYNGLAASSYKNSYKGRGGEMNTNQQRNQRNQNYP